MIKSIFVHLFKHKRQFNSWLLLLEMHGILEANVNKTSFSIVHSIVVCHVSGNLRIPGSVFQDHWYTLAYLNNQSWQAFSVSYVQTRKSKNTGNTNEWNAIIFALILLLSLLRFPMKLVNADITVVPLHSSTEVTMLTGCM